MKKILFTCVAVSALYATSTLAQTVTVAQPEEETASPVAVSAYQAPATEKQTITDAINLGLLYNGFDANVNVSVEQKGDDFTITIPERKFSDMNGKVQTLPAKTIEMKRVADFDKYAQYQVENITMPIIKRMFPLFAPNATVTDGGSSEIVFWVPDLALRTKQSLKVTDLTAQEPGFSFKNASIFWDALVGPKKDNKMDIANSLNVQDTTITNQFITISIPKINMSAQTLDVDQTSDALQQFLSASLSKMTMSLPKIRITLSPELTQMMGPNVGEAYVDMQLNNTLESTKDDATQMINTRFTLNGSMVDTKGLPIPADTLKNIELDVSLNDLNATQLQSILANQDKFDSALDEETPENIALHQDLEKESAAFMTQLRLNVNKLVIETGNSSMTFTGTAQLLEDGNPAMNGQLTVNNFDEMVNKMSLLTLLRPYMNPDEKDAQTKTFRLEFKNEELMINNQKFNNEVFYLMGLTDKQSAQTQPTVQ